MYPNKILELLGYNNLALILEQERKHWLMKTDKNVQYQDNLTGDIFQGQINNLGSDIIIESKKLDIKYDFIPDIKFSLEHADEIFKISNSAFPHSASVNGLMMSRIISINYQSIAHNNYKLKFVNAEEVILPFGISFSSPGVFAGKWIRTTTAPVLMLMDGNGNYTITKNVTFDSNVTHPVWYYPLEENLQPFEITSINNGEYTLQAINDNGFIGYPIFWFTCDNTNVGSNVTFVNNTNNRDEQILFIGNDGNSTPFDCKIYTGISGNYNGTPDGTSTSNYDILVYPASGSFNGNSSDFVIDIDTSNIVFHNTSTSTNYVIQINHNLNDSVRMNSDAPWVFDTDHYYVNMDAFDVNNINNVTKTALVPMFNVHFDESVPFVKPANEYGSAGVVANSSNLYSDKETRYPYDINEMEGLPTWMNDIEDNELLPEHLVAYAFHVPPGYTGNPEDLQGAAIIIDPGKPRDGIYTTNDNMGRVYVISNDDIEYRNNATEDSFKKPERTAARICDIPTSVVQLTGIHDLAPSIIVDKKYVRTECDFSLEAKDRLYNTIQTRWVRPYAYDSGGRPVNEVMGYTGTVVFYGENMLNKVDMYNPLNEFRYKTNLNPIVDANPIDNNVQVYDIANAGTGYTVNDIGDCIVGGFTFTYYVETVDLLGGVTAIRLVPNKTAYDTYDINLSNFDIDLNTGISEIYGTSPRTGSGTGLRFRFLIPKTYLDTILPSVGEFYPNLFALVKTGDGLYSYRYDINESSTTFPKPGRWVADVKLSEMESNSTSKANGGLSTKDSYLNSIIPSVRELPVSMKIDHIPTQNITVTQTASFVNVIDQDKSPVLPAMPSTEPTPPIDNIVDICKFHCDQLRMVFTSSRTRTTEAVIETLKGLNLVRYDSYIIWKWLTDDINDYRFQFGIIYRGFNNTFTTDTTTLLPANKLKCDNYVNTNPNTTIVWNVPEVGVMMWVYDPYSTQHEEYKIDPETRDLVVLRTPISYNDIDIVNGGSTKIVDNDGIFLFNVLTNNPVAVTTSSDVVYQQPEITQIINKGESINNISDKYKLKGNWRLVYPRINTFTIENDVTNTIYNPTKLQVISGKNITLGQNKIVNENDKDVSKKNLVISETNGELYMNLFNHTTGEWEIV